MRSAAALAVVFVLAVPAGAARGQADEAPRESRAQADEAPREARRSELPESVLRAERQTGGQVLRAESMQRDGREVYRLKVLTPDGRVRIVRDDPRERRRDIWRDPPGAARFERDDPQADSDPRLRPDERFDTDPDARFEPPPSDLDVPETLPPADRGDRH